MKTITVTEAFGSAPPRSSAVLCLKGAGGATDMILTEWFTWLNFKRNPMISFSLPKNAAYGTDLREGDSFALAFPPRSEALEYSKGVHLPAPAEDESALPDGTASANEDGLPALIPQGSGVVLHCTLAGAYNYPFKKVRIFTCNLEKACRFQEETQD